MKIKIEARVLKSHQLALNVINRDIYRGIVQTKVLQGSLQHALSVINKDIFLEIVLIKPLTRESL